MPTRFNPLQNAFVAGELTPRLEGRDDIRQYKQGLRQSVNQIVLPQGAAMHRSGTQFESETKGSGPVILRPFEVGLDQAYILEMGNEYMRFHANEGQLAIATVVNAVNFDGSSYASAASLAGIADTTKLMFSLWFQMLGGDGATQEIFDVGSFQLSRLASNALAFSLGGGSDILLKTTSALYTVAGNPGWHHVMGSVDLSLNRAQFYIDDNVPSLSGDFFAPLAQPAIPVSAAGPGIGTVGGSPGFANFSGDMAEVYVNTTESFDLSDPLNRRKFIDASGKPVGLGLQGDNPTGNPVILYLSGDTAAWHTNKGTGLGLTETGTLTTATSSPSD